MTRGEAALAAARAMLGTRFRLHGRGADGVDCVGLVGCAHGVAVPRGYALRSGDAARVGRAIASAGLVAREVPGPGDVLLLAVGPGQLHLAIQAEDGIIHADAMLRRVVARPGPLPWPLIGCWGWPAAR